jgi:hypothetical protein
MFNEGEEISIGYDAFVSNNGLGAGGYEMFEPSTSDVEGAEAAGRDDVDKAKVAKPGIVKRRKVKADTDSEDEVPHKVHAVVKNCMIDGIGVSGLASDDETDVEEEPNTEDEAFIDDECETEEDEDALALEHAYRVCAEYPSRRMDRVLNSKHLGDCVQAYKSLAAGDPDQDHPHRVISIRDMPRVLEAMRDVISSRHVVQPDTFQFKASGYSKNELPNLLKRANTEPVRSKSAPVKRVKAPVLKATRDDDVASVRSHESALSEADSVADEEDAPTALDAAAELKLTVASGGRTRFVFATAANLHPLCEEVYSVVPYPTADNCRRLCKVWGDRLKSKLAELDLKDFICAVEICPTSQRFHGHVLIVKPTAEVGALPNQIRVGKELRALLQKASSGVANHIKFGNAQGVRTIIGYIKKGDQPKPADGWGEYACSESDPDCNWLGYGLFSDATNIPLYFKFGGVNRGARKEVIALCFKSGDLSAVARTATSDQLAALVGCVRGIRDVQSMRTKPRALVPDSVVVKAYLGRPGSGKTRSAHAAATAKVEEIRASGALCDDPVWYSFNGNGGFMGGENAGVNSLVCIFDEIPPSLPEFQNVMKAWNKDGGPCQLSHCGSRPNFFGLWIYVTSKNHPRMWCRSIRGIDEDPDQVYRRLATVTFCEQTPLGYRTETRSRSSSSPWYDVKDWDRHFPDVTVTPPVWHQ